jgi:hypothetical protein
VANPIDFRKSWRTLPGEAEYDNAFKVQWELFLRHVVGGEPFPWDLLSGARGIQLAELAERSWREGRALEVPELAT